MESKPGIKMWSPKSTVSLYISFSNNGENQKDLLLDNYFKSNYFPFNRTILKIAWIICLLWIWKLLFLFSLSVRDLKSVTTHHLILTRISYRIEIKDIFLKLLYLTAIGLQKWTLLLLLQGRKIFSPFRYTWW